MTILYTFVDADGQRISVQRDEAGTPSDPIRGQRLAPGTDFAGRFGFAANKVSQIFTRPDDGLQYQSGEVVGTNPASVLQFQGAAKENGGHGAVTKAILQTTHTSFTGKLELYLFSDAPAAIADGNALNSGIDQDREVIIQFDAANKFSDGGGGSTIVTIPGTFLTPYARFKCASSSTTLTGQFATSTGFSSISQAQYRTTLYFDQY